MRFFLSAFVFFCSIIFYELSSQDIELATFNITSVDFVNSDGFPVPLQSDGFWEITWASKKNYSYRLERKRTISPGPWEEVGSIIAVDQETSLRDPISGNYVSTFWRVILLDDNGNEKQVSDIVTGIQAAQKKASTEIKIETGSDLTIDSILIYNKGLVVGNAQAGVDGSWYYSIENTGIDPIATDLKAVIINSNGESKDIDIPDFLIADSSRFVPIDADNRPLYGQYIEFSDSSNLKPFLFYPEGLNDPEKNTGAHFEFPEGAAILNTDGNLTLEFDNALFHRGYIDQAPLYRSEGKRRIEVNNINPGTISEVFDMPLGQIELLWGSEGFNWTAGSLKPSGWVSLVINPKIDEFNVPFQSSDTQIFHDANLEETYLVTKFYGNWEPVENVVFEIPSEEPIAIFTSRSGDINVSGSAIAKFDNGVRVKGKLKWASPHLYFQIQSNWTKVSSMRALGQLPGFATNSIEGIRANTDDDLDRLSDGLKGYFISQKTIKNGIATFSSEEEAQPLSSPNTLDSDPSILSAWVGRMKMSILESPIQLFEFNTCVDLLESLDEISKELPAIENLKDSFENLNALVEMKNLAKSVIPVTHRSIVIAKLEDLLSLNLFVIELIADKQTELQLTNNTSQAFQYFGNALEAISNDNVQANNQLSFNSSTIIEPFKPLQNASQSLVERLTKAYEKVYGKIPLNLFYEIGVVKGDFSQNNIVLSNKSIAELFEILNKAKVITDAIKSGNNDISVTEFPDQFPVLETLIQCQPFIFSKLNQMGSQALTKADISFIRQYIDYRIRIQKLYVGFDTPLSMQTDLFDPDLRVIINSYLDILKKTTSGQLAHQRRPSYLRLGYDLAQIAKYSIDAEGVYYKDVFSQVLYQLMQVNSLAGANLLGVSYCDDLLIQLFDMGFAVPGYDEGNYPVAISDFTGRYETQNQDLSLTTLQINQAGIYLKGQIQTRSGGGGKLLRFHIKGMLLSSDSDVTIFSYVRLGSENQEVVSAGTMFLDRSQNTTSAILQEASGYNISLERMSELPFQSDLLISEFPVHVQEALLAFKHYPMHSKELEYVINAIINLKSEIDFYAITESDTEQTASSLRIEQIIRNLKNKLAPEQDAAVRVVLKMLLLKSTPMDDGNSEMGNNTINSPSNYDYWLNLIYHSHYQLMPKTGILLGFDPEIENMTQKFHYDVEVTYYPVGADIKWGIGGGGVGVRVIVKKTDFLQNVHTFQLFGTLAKISAGIGFSIKRLAELGTSTDKFSFDSGFDYHVEDLVGPISSLGTGFSLPFGQVQAAEICFWGSGRLPVITYTPDLISDTMVIALSLDLNGLIGALFLSEDESLENPFTEDQRFLNASVETSFAGSIDFEVDSDAITSCGRQKLREFIAEFKAMFGSSSSTVQVIGMTDTTGEDSYNLNLSQQRANAVKTAIQEIMGIPPNNSDDRITALGLGETVSSIDYNLDNNSDNKNLISKLRYGKRLISDNVDDPLWRTVEVIVNDTVKTKLNNP